MRALDLATLRVANNIRAHEWRARDGVGSTWTGADWGNEMGGACGEAQNVIKKLRRLETGYKGPSPSRMELLYHLGQELGDVVICADLVAIHYGIDLAWATIDKFNLTSIKQNLETKL